MIQMPCDPAAEDKNLWFLDANKQWKRYYLKIQNFVKNLIWEKPFSVLDRQGQIEKGAMATMADMMKW